MMETTGTLGKILAVLDIVAQSEQPMRFTDILARANEPRGTLHRHLTHLVAEGLLELVSQTYYRPGLRLLKLASRAWANNDVRSAADPYLQALREETGETVHLGVLQGTEIIYVDKVEGRQSVRMHSNIGKASPVYCTGIGKAALSCLQPEKLEPLLSRLNFEIFTPNTLPDVQALRRDLSEIAKLGHAFDRQEHEIGICCVAASVTADNGRFVGGVSVSGPAFRITEAQLQEWALPVRKTAEAISRELASRLGP
jgi:IclR family transcriptional regulator, acetate operon repressor